MWHICQLQAEWRALLLFGKSSPKRSHLWHILTIKLLPRLKFRLSWGTGTSIVQYHNYCIWIIFSWYQPLLLHSTHLLTLTQAHIATSTTQWGAMNEATLTQAHMATSTTQWGAVNESTLTQVHMATSITQWGTVNESTEPSEAGRLGRPELAHFSWKNLLL